MLGSNIGLARQLTGQNSVWASGGIGPARMKRRASEQQSFKQRLLDKITGHSSTVEAPMAFQRGKAAAQRKTLFDNQKESYLTSGGAQKLCHHNRAQRFEYLL